MEEVAGIPSESPLVVKIQLSIQERLAIIGAVLYYSVDFNRAVFVRFFELFYINNETATTLSSFIPLLLVLPLLNRRRSALCRFTVFYLLVATYFAVSILLNVDNWQYYFRPQFGVHRVFRPDSGIFAIFFILVLGKKRLIEITLQLTTFIMFVMHSMQFLRATTRGYWLYINQFGQEDHLSYSLEFGFGMAFVVVLCMYFGFTSKRRLYYLFSLLGYLMIIKAGNRMALILPFVFLILWFLHKKMSVCRNNACRIRFLLNFIFKGVIVVITLFLVLKLLMDYSHVLGLDLSSSRNVSMIIDGTFLADNGRTHIRQLVWEGLKHRPLLGLGAFGDRPLVAPVYIWGHSHSFIFEVWSNLGLLFGIPFAFVLFYGWFRFTFCRKAFYSNLFLVFFSISFLHLTSLSFWLTPYIWSCFALLILERDYQTDVNFAVLRNSIVISQGDHDGYV
jgi:hypothetical protein